jgi:hypothetical protein
LFYKRVLPRLGKKVSKGKETVALERHLGGRLRLPEEHPKCDAPLSSGALGEVEGFFVVV